MVSFGAYFFYDYDDYFYDTHDCYVVCCVECVLNCRGLNTLKWVSNECQLYFDECKCVCMCAYNPNKLAAGSTTSIATYSGERIVRSTRYLKLGWIILTIGFRIIVGL